jgi:hypothetical protein
MKPKNFVTYKDYMASRGDKIQQFSALKVDGSVLKVLQ